LKAIFFATFAQSPFLHKEKQSLAIFFRGILALFPTKHSSPYRPIFLKKRFHTAMISNGFFLARHQTKAVFANAFDTHRTFDIGKA